MTDAYTASGADDFPDHIGGGTVDSNGSEYINPYFSSDQPTYSQWRYGEEASLYSIAEDSREGRQSEATSRTGTDVASSQQQSAQATSTSSNPWEQNAPVDVMWLVDTDGDLSEGDSENGGENALKGVDVSDDSGEPVMLGYGHNPRARLIYTAIICIFCLVVLAVVLGVTLFNRDDGQSRGSVSTGVQEQEQEQMGNEIGTPTISPPTFPTPSPSAPTLFPTNMPSSSLPPTEIPTSLPGRIETLSKSSLVSALGECTPASILQDPSTLQGQVYEQMWKDLVDSANVTQSDDSVQITLDASGDELLEKYALLMLFKSTSGEDWKNNDGWESTSDVCEWYGSSVCTRRAEGGCALSSLDLPSNGLSGQLPEEICCIPCLRKLNLSFNRIRGQVPACLPAMNLEKLDLEGNKNVFYQSTEP